MEEHTIYARAELISIPEDDPVPEGYWVTDFTWNVDAADLLEWASRHPENFRFRAIAFEPIRKKEK